MFAKLLIPETTRQKLRLIDFQVFRALFNLFIVNFFPLIIFSFVVLVNFGLTHFLK
jgi:hypothetical protein